MLNSHLVLIWVSLYNRSNPSLTLRLFFNAATNCPQPSFTHIFIINLKITFTCNFFWNFVQINGVKSPAGHNVRAKDGILFTSLYGMTFMLGCCPILSRGVARRREHPHCTSVFWEMMGPINEFSRSVTYYLLSTLSLYGSMRKQGAVKMDHF